MRAVSSHTPAKYLVPLTRIQKLISQRMLGSKRAKPCFYLAAQADITELMDSRHQLKKATGIKITTNAFHIRAIGLAAAQFPLVLAKLDGSNLRIADSVNVGFAVNAPQGLVVPVVKDAQQKSLAEIAKLEELLTQKARANKLTLEDISQENIALSNLGAYGVDSFIGIVPPPASVILAVGNTLHKMVPKDGRPTERKMVSLTAAVDHRIVNGNYAAKFLNRIKQLLENPRELT